MQIVSRRISCALLVSLALATTSFGASYQIINYPTLQNGLVVSGVIDAVDSDNDTVLDSNELSAWSLTINGNTVTSSSPIANTVLSNVSISSGAIYLEDAEITGLEERLILAIALDQFVHYYNAPYSSDLNIQIYNGRAGRVPAPEWASESLVEGRNLPMPSRNGRMIIARIVPEPTSAWLIVCTSLLLYWRYNQKWKKRGHSTFR